MHMLVVLRSHNFVSAEQAAAFLGVVPIEKRSGTSVRRRPRMSKIGPPQLRAKLYMSALCGKIYNKRMRNIYDEGNAVNLLMTILICSHSILVTSG